MTRKIVRFLDWVFGVTPSQRRDIEMAKLRADALGIKVEDLPNAYEIYKQKVFGVKFDGGYKLKGVYIDERGDKINHFEFDDGSTLVSPDEWISKRVKAKSK